MVALTGCVRTLDATAVQSNPIKTRRLAGDSVQSAPLYILTRDMHLPRWLLLRSSASFAAVSRDRIRFHVGIVQHWEEMADTAGWEIWLEDETGRRLEPQRREVPRVERVAVEWINELRLDAVLRMTTRRLEPSQVLNVYQGKVDVVFMEQDLLSPARQALALVLERDGVRLRYEWRFRDDAWSVAHYGMTTNPTVIVVPGPMTRVASSFDPSEE